MNDKVRKVCVPQTDRDRWYEVWDWIGEPAAVVQAVATHIRQDHVVRCYEHMLTRVVSAEVDGQGTLRVRTSKSHYAGD